VFRKMITKKRALVLGAVAVLAVAGIAIAYWTASGEGEGSGKVASSNGSLVLHGSISNELTPGSTSPVTFSADNAGSSSLQVGTVHAVVSTDKEGCEVSDFTIADTVENQSIPAKSSEVALSNNGSITMADTEANQDACKGATITLTLSSE
jgi:hypothetical protein